jgi:hypothetical protein
MTTQLEAFARLEAPLAHRLVGRARVEQRLRRVEGDRVHARRVPRRGAAAGRAVAEAVNELAALRG